MNVIEMKGKIHKGGWPRFKDAKYNTITQLLLRILIEEHRNLLPSPLLCGDGDGDGDEMVV